MTMNAENEKIVLVIPNTMWHGRRPWMIVPHAPLILTALLKDKFDFFIIDANVARLSEEECARQLKELDPKVVLVSGFGTEYYQQYHTVMSMSKTLNPECITVLGGVYPTVLSEEAIKDKNIDYLFLGHAEERVADFLNIVMSYDFDKIKSFAGIIFRDNAGNVITNPMSSYIGDVLDIVKPDYSLIDIDGYLKYSSKDYQFNSDRPSAPIISSYGCPYNCSFCASRTISGRGVVYRNMEDVLDEIEFLVYNHGVGNLVFIDDCLLANRPRIEGILNAFIEKKYNITWKAASVSAWHLDNDLLNLMKRSGCVQITISVESGSQRVLRDVMHKPLRLEIVPGIVKTCKEASIDIGANFVIGNPGETWDEIRQTFKFAEQCNFDLAHFHIATPLPKTELYETALKMKLLPEGFSFLDPNFFGYGRGYITTDEFTPAELMVLRAYEWDRINFDTPEKIEKACKMMCLSPEELKEHRKNTRLKCGIHF